MEIITSPLQGVCVPLQQVSDPVFSEEIIGRGVAIKPKVGLVYAPARGEISMVADTKHCICITADNGAEILIHIGLDTTRLKGKYFMPLVHKGQHVEQGDLIMKFDLDKIAKKRYDTVVPVLIMNHNDIGELTFQHGEVNADEHIISFA